MPNLFFDIFIQRHYFFDLDTFLKLSILDKYLYNLCHHYTLYQQIFTQIQNRLQRSFSVQLNSCTGRIFVTK